MLIRVEGGTGAGSKKPLKEARKEPWRCGCGRMHAGFYPRCPDTFPARGAYVRP